MDSHADGITCARSERVVDAGALRVPVLRRYTEIRHDPHDLIPRFLPALLSVAGVAKAPADRVIAPEHQPSERLVHDDGPGAWPQVPGVKRTAGKDRRVQHLEEVQSDPGQRHPTA